MVKKGRYNGKIERVDELLYLAYQIATLRDFHFGKARKQENTRCVPHNVLREIQDSDV